VELNEIKEIIKKSGGKFIIIEDGKPEIVIMSFEDFKKDLEKPSQGIAEQETKNEIINRAPEKPPIPKELEEEPLKIEDLPF
jgi:hypothetical protein